jgi:plastocyanin
VRLRLPISVLAGASVLALAGGCSLSEDDPDLVAGKALFIEKCSSCHTLARADARGTTGPNLDEAFQHALASGMGRSGVEGAVYEQILHPAKVAKDNAKVYMPARLVTGDDATNVAAYVAEVAARRGKDSGLLAEAGKPEGGGEPAVARNGVLEIEALAQLAYVTNAARAEPGQLTVRSPNPSGTPHNIALEGPGVSDAVGDVVQGGGVSEVEVRVRRGEYQFFCTVEGHREGGMEGTLTVE